MITATKFVITMVRIYNRLRRKFWEELGEEHPWTPLTSSWKRSVNKLRMEAKTLELQKWFILRITTNTLELEIYWEMSCNILSIITAKICHKKLKPRFYFFLLWCLLFIRLTDLNSTRNYFSWFLIVEHSTVSSEAYLNYLLYWQMTYIHQKVYQELRPATYNNLTLPMVWLP